MNSNVEYMCVSGWRVFGLILLWAAPLAVFGSSLEVLEGLPPTRKYPFESIGAVSRGARLGFDDFDRLVVIEEGTYSVLNDEVWLDLSAGGLRESNAISLVQGEDGSAYYGGFGEFGMIRFGRDGRVAVQSLLETDGPDWMRTAIFDDDVACSEGVYFGSWNGVVYCSYDQTSIQYFGIENVRDLFRVGDQAFVSTTDGEVIGIVLGKDGTSRYARTQALECGVVETAAPWGEGSALLSDAEGRLWLFDGSDVVPWDAQDRYDLRGRVSSLEPLADGGVAVAVFGRGVFLFDKSGEFVVSLDTTEYHRVHEMASHEEGVLWIVSSNSIDKILYGSPLTEYGQRLGALLDWPQIGFQDGRMYVASDGQFYEEHQPDAMGSGRFELAAEQLGGGVRSVASSGGRMLLGNRSGVYSWSAEGGFERVLKLDDLLNLAMVGSELCFAIGRNEIVAIGFRDGNWREVATRIKGLEYAPVAHSTEHSAWVEMGRRGVMRIWLGPDDSIRSEFVENVDWGRTGWVNVGFIEDKVVLSTLVGRRVFDESSQCWVDSGNIDALLSRSPRRVDRVWQGEDGALWATHSEGVVVFMPSESSFEMNTFGLGMLNDRYPRVVLGNGGEVWIVAARSLFRVRSREVGMERLKAPSLVSLAIGGERIELPKASGEAVFDKFTLSFEENNPSFRFFSGGYSWKTSPLFEYRFQGREAWTAIEGGSLLTFNRLRDGDYSLEVRMSDSFGRSSDPVVLAFAVLPPWYGSAYAYMLYAAGIVLIVSVAAMLPSQLARRRNRELEAVVHERTLRLESAMVQLEEKTRNAATLAERQRLAGEVHDSLQQGIIGAIIQLDATLSLPEVPRKVLSRLNVVRNMISFVKQEVQHLVWDLDSTLNNKDDLDVVLRDLVKALNSTKPKIVLERKGDSIALSNDVRHNLLRIAQECCTNSIRHSQASKVVVRLVYRSDEIELSIEDDGVGFDRDLALSGGLGHFGLRGIESRSKKVGGMLGVSSEPGIGTQVSISVPLNKNGKQ